MSRRSFLAAAGIGGTVLSGLSWAALGAPGEPALPSPKPRVPLKVLPILVWDHPQRAEQRSWRNWGGVHTPEAAAEEVARIKKELAEIAKTADFPVEFAEVASVNRMADMAKSPQVEAADAIIVYGAGHNIGGCENFGKDVILFQRHRSGPVYLQYEIVSPRFLRRHTDQAAFAHIRDEDVVTDRPGRDRLAAPRAVRPEEHAGHEGALHRRAGARGRSRRTWSRNWSKKSGGLTW
jgi:hypothetical protein